MKKVLSGNARIRSKRRIIKDMLVQLVVYKTAVGYWLSFTNFNSLKMLAKFLFSKKISIPFSERVKIIRRFNIIETNILAGHSADELLLQAYFLLSLSAEKKGCIVEAGSFKGASAAKLSIIAKITGREFYIFDSFKGLPPNAEPATRTTVGYTCNLREGACCGYLDEIRENIKKFGEIEPCHFIPGWFKNTLPHFKKEVLMAFCDVDLALSARTCIRHLYPLLVAGGRLFSHDAHFPLIDELFKDENFWKSELGMQKPVFYRLTKRFGYFEK